VLGRVVDSVNTDSIDAQLLELDDISLAAIGIGDGISQVGGATGLIVDATDIESVIACEECCNDGSICWPTIVTVGKRTIAFDRDRRQAAALFLYERRC
jgi:hypothetical protein